MFCFVFIHDSFNLQLWIQQHTVFTENGYWKRSWAHTVSFTTESYLLLMHCCWRNQILLLFFYLSLAYTDFSKLFELINDNMYNRWWKSQSILDWDVLLWNCSKTNLFNLHNFSKFYPPVLLLNIFHDTKSIPVQTGWLDVAFLCEACMFSLCQKKYLLWLQKTWKLSSLCFTLYITSMALWWTSI